MDIIMLEMDGLETLRRLRTIVRQSRIRRQSPAVALTAKSRRKTSASYLQAGFAGVSAEPIDVADLASAYRARTERSVHA